MADQDKPPYAVLGGYELRRELGRGGMGVVYEAYDPVLDRTVALKILPRKLAADKSYAARFLNEARAAARLNHPNIVTIHAVGEAEGRQFIAMECVRGLALSAIVKTGQPMVVSSALQILRQAAEALGAAHGQGIIHRDIKPQNIMVDAANRVKVLDFGLAKLLESSTGLTSVGTALGTPRYMAPEQVQGKPADARSDIYSLGVVFYELLAGRPAFQGDSPMAVMYQIVHEPFPSLSDAQLKVPAGVERILQKMVARDPEERYPSTAELLDDLETLETKGEQKVAQAKPVVAEVRPVPVIVDDSLRSDILSQTAAKFARPGAEKPLSKASRRRSSRKRIVAGLFALSMIGGLTVRPLMGALFGQWTDLLADPNLSHWRIPNAAEGADLGHWHMEGDVLATQQDSDPVQDLSLTWGVGEQFIATRRDWRDFELDLEYKVTPDVNSGIFLRGCVEVQIGGDDGSKERKIRTGAISGQYGPLADAARPPGEWNRLEVTVVNELVMARLNGVLIHDYVGIKDATWRIAGDPFLGGPLILERWGGRVWFRNVRIRQIETPRSALVNIGPDGHEWRYTTQWPGHSWNTVEFDDSEWRTGKSAFGNYGHGQLGARTSTSWDTPDIWLRTVIEIPQKFGDNLAYLYMIRDDEAEVYVNGVPLIEHPGWSHPLYRSLTDEERRLFRPGQRNILAMHCHDVWCCGKFIGLALEMVSRNSSSK